MVGRAAVLEVLGYLLIALSVYFYIRCVDFVAGHEYVSAIITMFVGLFTSNVGAELARLSLWQRKGG